MGRFKHILLFISIVVCLSDSVPLPYNVQSLTENDDSQKDVSEQIESVNEKVNNNLFEGDIILDNNTRDVDGTQDGNVKRNAQRNRASVWETKVVPYIIAPDLSSQTRIIQQAFDEFRKHTCVTFVPRTNESNWIYFVKKSGCYSYVGKSYWRSGGQDVSIGKGCAYKGTIIHELLHALGFWHEQSRPDRDKYVRILWGNIKPGKDHNFKKYDHGRIDSLKATYDLGSIMHYGKHSFSSNGKPTIEAINDPNRQLGQRSGFSQTDIFEVNALYDCSGPAHGWSSWSDYGPCDRTCDKIRQRFCASSDRSNCPGADSYGVETETTICYANECSVSHDCEFEVDMCIWKTDPNNNYRWHRRQGQTSSYNTGPDGDATQTLNGTGYYIYAESSSPVQTNQKTQLTSPVFNATSGRCLEFAYSMYGSAMGSLDVYVENVKTGTKKTIFTTSGNQGQGWHRTNATITSSSDYKVVFEVTRGPGFTSDVALDDIFFKDGKCGGQGPTSTTSPPWTTTAPTTSQRPSTRATTTSSPSTTDAPTTTQRPSTRATTTSSPSTTDAPTTTQRPSTRPTTTSSPSTTAAPTTTQRPSTRATTTSSPSTTAAPTTTQRPSTRGTTTSSPSTTDAPTTTQRPSTRPTTTSSPSTTAAPTTTQRPSTRATTTSSPSTTAAPTTTQRPSTRATTTSPPSTTAAPTTTQRPSTRATTTSPPSTTAAPTTTQRPSTRATTTSPPSTTAAPTTTQRPSTRATTTSPPWTTSGPGTSSPAPTGLDDCDFEVNVCSWTSNPTNTYRWYRKNGGTPSYRTGPNGDATKPLNGKGYYIYAEASSPVRTNKKTQLTSPVFNATSGRCLEFAYSMYGSAMGSLDVYVENVKSGTKKTIFTTSGNQGQGWHRTNATITSSSDYKVVFEVTRGHSFTSDVALDDIFFKDGKCGGQGPTIFGADCNFDQDMCGWMPGPKTHLRWFRRSGRTPSRKTGPRRDHTSGSGYYVYVETSSPARPQQTATLVSRVFPPAPAGRCLSFYYHMYGATMGSLNVYIRSASTAVQVRVFRISGNKRNKWRRGMVNISNLICDYQIVFEGVRGSSYLSDMALDDITFTSSPCPKRRRG